MICGNKVDLRNEADGNQSVTQTEGAQLAAVSDCIIHYITICIVHRFSWIQRFTCLS